MSKNTKNPVRTSLLIHDDDTYTYKTEMDDGSIIYHDTNAEEVWKFIEKVEGVVSRHVEKQQTKEK